MPTTNLHSIEFRYLLLRQGRIRRLDNRRCEVFVRELRLYLRVFKRRGRGVQGEMSYR